MVGYGPESSHFVIELTYNYGVKSYEMGNWLQIHVQSIAHTFYTMHLILQAMTLVAWPSFPRMC